MMNRKAANLNVLKNGVLVVLDFKVYSRHIRLFRSGLSGDVFIARVKGFPTLIIKGSEYQCACNEFIAARLAEYLGVNMPKAHLLTNVPAGDTRITSGRAIGLEYIENLESFDPIRCSHPEEYSACIALNILCNQRDGVELYVKDGHVYTMDFSDAFDISSFAIQDLIRKQQIINVVGSEEAAAKLIAQAMNREPEPFIPEQLMINALNSYRKNMDIAELLQVITDVIQKKHGLKIDIKPVIEKMAAITDEQIIDICAPLDSIYPQAVSIVFEEIIKHMRESSERFLFHDLD